MKLGNINARYGRNILLNKGHPDVPISLPENSVISISAEDRSGSFSFKLPGQNYAHVRMSDIPGNCGAILFYQVPGGDPYSYGNYPLHSLHVKAAAEIAANIAIYGGYAYAEVSIDKFHVHAWNKVGWKEYAVIPSGRETHNRNLHYLYFNAKEHKL